MSAVKQSVERERAIGVRTAGQMRRVLVVTYHFPPSMAMGAQACAQIARYLPLHGWEPTVLTVREPYSENRGVPPERAFPGRVVRTRVLPDPLSLYRSVKSALRFGHDGAESVAASPDQMGNLRRWVLSLLLIGDGYTGWLPPASVAGLKVILREGIEHLFSSGPPWASHLLGLVLSGVTGLPWTVHLRDPWTQGQQLKPMSAVGRRIEAGLERLTMKRAAFVVCVTEQHAEMLRRIYPDLPPSKFVTIPNGFDEGEWNGIETGTDGTDKFRITYGGELYMGRNPLPVFRAVRALIDAHEIDPGKIEIELFGRCETAEGRRVAEMVANSGLSECVSLKGPFSRPLTLRKLARSGLLLLLAEGLTVQIPGKTYEYLRAGRPILALTSEGAVAELLRKSGGGWVVDPADHDGIVAAVREAYRGWKDGHRLPAAGRAVVASFDRRVLAGRFAELFTHAVRGRR